MAVKQTSESTSSMGRRFFFGTNVLVMIIFATLIVIGLNYLGKRFDQRTDLTGGFGSAQLSTRTKKILDDVKQDIRISTVYTSDVPGKEADEYLPKLRDLTDEIERYSDHVTVQHLRTGPQRAELRDEIQGKFAGTSKAYQDVIAKAEAVWDQTRETLKPYLGELNGLLTPDHWLMQFTEVANLVAELNQGLEDLDETQREVRRLVDVSEGIPRYKEANDKIKEANDKIKQLVEQTRDQLETIHDLVVYLDSPDESFVETTKDNARELTALAQQLQQAIGEADSEEMPEDPVPTLQKYARTASRLGQRLAEEVGRVEAYLEEHPELQRHPRLRVRLTVDTNIGKINLGSALLTTETAKAAAQISSTAEQLRGFLANEKVAPDDLKGLVRQLRGEWTPTFVRAVNQWTSGMNAVVSSGKQIDPATREFLTKTADDDYFKQTLDGLAEVSNAIEELPELQLDTLAEGLEEDNIVVVETADDVKIVPFEKVWAPADDSAQRFGQQDQQRRLFVGDNALSSAILELQHAEPFGTVVFVGYEPMVSPPQNPMMPQQQQRPQRATGRIPLEQLSVLKNHFEQANFKVETWNMAEAPEPPEIGETEEAVYIFLPPAHIPQNPMMGQPPPAEPFGAKQMEQVRKILEDNGRAIFLTAWMPKPEGMMAEYAMSYAFEDYLRESWGIDADVRYRLMRAEQDRHDTDRYAVDIVELQWMRLNSFTDQPIGEPLQSRRVLMVAATPVDRADNVPSDVTLTPILDVPEDTNNVWAVDYPEFRRIHEEVLRGDGTFTRMPDHEHRPPMSVVLLGENTKTNSRIIVMGTGDSPVDDFLNNPVPQLEKGGRFKTEPPPTEVVDLYLNSVFWLTGQNDLIAAGPTEVPVVRHLDVEDKQVVRGVTMGWAVVVLLVGGVVMLMRRK